MADKVERYGAETMAYIEKQVLLQTLDHLWREHLVTLDHLRQVIGFRGYGQRDPLNEYRTEAFTLFEAMLTNLRKAVTAQVMRVELIREDRPTEAIEPSQVNAQATPLPSGPSELRGSIDPVTMAEMALFGSASIGQALPGKIGADTAELDRDDPSTWGKVNRNDACPCGSGKKYKHCHGRLA
jgi:preprotein translocase subunit SecA